MFREEVVTVVFTPGDCEHREYVIDEGKLWNLRQRSDLDIPPECDSSRIPAEVMNQLIGIRAKPNCMCDNKITGWVWRRRLISDWSDYDENDQWPSMKADFTDHPEELADREAVMKWAEGCVK